MDEQSLRADYQIGLEAESFLRSEVGKILVEMAKQDRLLALEKFVGVDAGDKEKIAAIQLEVRIAESIPAYLEELVTRSYQAELALKQMN